MEYFSPTLEPWRGTDFTESSVTLLDLDSPIDFESAVSEL